VRPQIPGKDAANARKNVAGLLDAAFGRTLSTYNAEISELFTEAPSPVRCVESEC
jgi:hypothetical protein